MKASSSPVNGSGERITNPPPLPGDDDAAAAAATAASLSPQLWAPGGARASRAEGGGRREGGCRWPGWRGERARRLDTRGTPPGSTPGGSKRTRHKGGSRRSCPSAALPVTGVAPPPPPPPPPPQSPALPGLSVSGLWCSAGGGATGPTLRVRARRPALPRPSPGAGGALGGPGAAWLSSLQPPRAGWGWRAAGQPRPFTLTHTYAHPVPA